MKYEKEITNIIRRIFNTADSLIVNEKTEYTGNFERLNERRQYDDQFVQHRRASNMPQRLQIQNEELKGIYRSISYIPMAPENKHYFEQCYSIQNNRDQELEEIGIEQAVKSPNYPINYSKSRAKEFIELIVDRAAKLVALRGESLEACVDYCKYLLVGPAGIGKTAFINYLFSTNSDFMDNKNVIFVRVNLNDIQIAKNSLKERLCSKWLRIFAKYYFREKIVAKDFESQFHEYFKTERLDHSFFERYPIKKKEDIFAHFIKELHEIHEKSFEQHEFSVRSIEKYDERGDCYISSDDLCLLTTIAMSFVQTRLGYGFIVVFDGFDSVSFDQIQYREYANWLYQIDAETTIGNKSLYRAVYIVTMRDYSFIRFYHNRLQHDNEDTSKMSPSKFIQLKITQATPREVIEKRFYYLFLKQSLKEHRNLMRNLINLMFMCYKGCEPQKALSSNWDEVTSVISELFSSNYRLLFRFLRELLSLSNWKLRDRALEMLKSSPESLVFLSAFRGSEWQVLKLFVMGTSNVQLFHNRTKYDIDGQPLFLDVTPIVPNIFNFNEYGYLTPEADENKTALVCSNKILVKIRMLQHLQSVGGETGVLNIFDWLKKTFQNGWGQELRYETREMIFNNILECNVDEINVHKDEYLRTNYHVRLTSKASVIDMMLDSSIYYETIMDNTPIDKRYIKYLKPLHPIEKKDTWEYLKDKTFFIIFFVCYLTKVEGEELARTTLSDANYNAHFRIFGKERFLKINESILKYLSGYVGQYDGVKVQHLLNEWEKDLGFIEKKHVQ